MTINSTLSSRNNVYKSKICNATLTHGWIEPERQLIIIESLVLSALMLMFILFICGFYRRKSNNWLVTSLLLIANGATFPLVTYIIGMMQTSPCYFRLFSIWAMCMMMVHYGTNTVSVYSLEENESWKAHFIKGQAQAFLVWGLVVTYGLSDYGIPLSMLYFTVCSRGGLRTISFRLAAMNRSEFFHRTKLISDHMIKEHTITTQEQVDPVSMQGYNYLVESSNYGSRSIVEGCHRMYIDVEENHVITTAKVWALKGRLLGDEGDSKGKLKDLCLSFALYKMLLRRFYGYPLAESVQPKTRQFIFEGLLSNPNHEDDHERPFRVVEVELSFLYDYFYTRFPAIYMLEKAFLAVELIIITSSIWLAIELIDITSDDSDIQHYYLEHYVITIVFVILIVIIEMAQIVAYLISDWAKISFVYKYMVHSSCHGTYLIEWMLQLLCSIQFWAHWKNSLGQYSLLQNFGYRAKFHNLIRPLISHLMDEIKDGRKESPSVEVPILAKRQIISALRYSSNGVLQNGILTLKRYNIFKHLKWACSFQSDTQTILVWHVATTLCEIRYTRGHLAEATHPMHSAIKDKITVAASLSNYCAYLVAFVPELLPDNRYDCEFTFDMVVEGANQILSSNMTQDQICDNLLTTGDIYSENTVLKGAGLANQLLTHVEDIMRRWELLAEFWSEMILYVPPSNDATSHLRNLAKGGEFVTQLWALLSHAGILERAPKSNELDQNAP